MEICGSRVKITPTGVFGSTTYRGIVCKSGTVARIQHIQEIGQVCWRQTDKVIVVLCGACIMVSLID
jgi:hypothetical protein